MKLQIARTDFHFTAVFVIVNTHGPILDVISSGCGQKN